MCFFVRVSVSRPFANEFLSLCCAYLREWGEKHGKTMLTIALERENISHSYDENKLLLWNRPSEIPEQKLWDDLVIMHHYSITLPSIIDRLWLALHRLQAKLWLCKNLLLHLLKHVQYIFYSHVITIGKVQNCLVENINIYS